MSGLIYSPKSAVCPGGGPPIFNANVIESSLELSEFPTGVANPEELTLQALADILGIDKSLIVISEDARRAAVVRFQIHSSPEQIDRVMSALSDTSTLTAGLSQELAATHNISIDIVLNSPVAIGERDGDGSREGEVWEEVDGQYILRACGAGSLLVNSSLDAQECVPCLPKTYTLDDFQV